MSLYYRLDLVPTNDDEYNGRCLVIRPESSDDWKMFSYKEHAKWTGHHLVEYEPLTVCRGRLHFSLQAVNLINLESILKYHQLTGKSIIPKSILIDLHHR